MIAYRKDSNGWTRLPDFAPWSAREQAHATFVGVWRVEGALCEVFDLEGVRFAFPVYQWPDLPPKSSKT